MRILHTSDWHLGRTLYGKKRTREFEQFLDWLLETLRAQKVDVLIVAGDVFDTTTPSNRMQQFYYRFLCRLSETGCRHAVVVGGNHDSPSFLDAPGELLRFLDVHVIGSAGENPGDELLTLRNSDGDPELIVCAVPCLRDRDVRTFEVGESVEDKDRKTLQGIEAHYRELGRLTEEKLAEIGCRIPVVATGHLFVAGGQSSEGDGVRDLYIGTMACFDAERFPSGFDYLALGHLHSPQRVSSSETMRYSGSPLPMNPAEAEQHKSVTLVAFSEGMKEITVETIPVPVFQELKRIAGDMETIRSRVDELRFRGSSAWLEIVYEGQEILPDLRERVNVLVAGSEMEILRIKNMRSSGDAGPPDSDGTAQDTPDVAEVFARCLEIRSVPDSQRTELIHTYREVLRTLDSEDPLQE